MPLFPDRARVIFSETNVDMPAGLRQSSACDLTLYHEAGRTGRGVMVVSVICSLTFRNGTATSGGATLTWTQAEKTGFMNSLRSQVNQVWSEKHRISTRSTVPAVTDFGVMFDARVSENLSVFSHSHWNIAVVKVDSFNTSSVDVGGGGFAWNGSANLDSSDVNCVAKGGPVPQRATVHEFGHMMGLRDEYRNAAGAAEDNPNWLTDLGSVMNVGESIRDRHYAMFADWVTRQHHTIARLARSAIIFKVNGTLELPNALL